ncbi:MAG TPA: DUF1501 domain-containing protein [Kiritimatiellia bacterium]|nr:DUF1501 domain-containing protein [Kiritimatiellia bacterium]HPS06186.1 DUF1501 domain-containing protein [Kiritimatiellia bacterium]
MRGKSTGATTRRGFLQAGLRAGLAFPFIPVRNMFAAMPQKTFAKAVIQIWMWGGPSHLDTFDPKPDAGNDYCGPLNAPIPTAVAGMRIGQLLPLLAKRAGDFSLVRSMTHGINAHETASYVVQTGRTPGDGQVYPAVGAVVAFKKASRASGLIPPYIALTKPLGRFSEAGFLGSRYKPFATGGDPNANVFAAEGIVTEGISRERQERRRGLLAQLDTLDKKQPSPLFDAMAAGREQAYELILGEPGKVFDLSLENDAVRDRYGRNTFGQSCLAARRLIEQGAVYVSINYPGWDTHKQHFNLMSRKLPEFDTGLSALLEDLAQRGLLAATIVWCGGEFGRTPKIQWEAPWNGGRGHYGKAFSTFLAGGGFRGGQIVGATDARGEEIEKDPVYPTDLIAAIYGRLGFDAADTVPHPQGLNIPLVPARETSAGPTPLNALT